MIKILFLGAHSPEWLIQMYPKYSLGKYNVSQFIINELKSREDISISVVTSPDLPSYPRLPVYLKKVKDAEALMVSSLNLPILKQGWTILSMLWNAVKEIKKNKTDVLIIPYMVFRHVVVSRMLKHIFPKLKICVIVPDIFFPREGTKEYYLNKWAVKHGVKSDAFVLYTDAMADYLNIRNKAYIVEEGFLDTEYFDDLISKCEIESNCPTKRIVYSGGLMKQYGILRLLESMKYIADPSVELVLYGDGDAVNDIKYAAENDTRIKYMGWASKEEIFRAQVKASVLVNPRAEKDGDFTQYSCPSKILEYLYSGTPTVACPLSGIPVCYYEHFLLTDGTPKSLAEAINKGISMTSAEKNKLFENNRLFIRECVGIDNQCTRIVNLFRRIL